MICTDRRQAAELSHGQWETAQRPNGTSQNNPSQTSVAKSPHIPGEMVRKVVQRPAKLDANRFVTLDHEQIMNTLGEGANQEQIMNTLINLRSMVLQSASP